MHTATYLHALVDRIQNALEMNQLKELNSLAHDAMGRNFLGIAGFLEYAKVHLTKFLQNSSPDDTAIDHICQILIIVALVVSDEDNAVHAAQLGLHGILLKFLVHENEHIQERASEVVVICSTHNCNTSGINIAFPYKTLPLEPPKRSWPSLQLLPIDSRDNGEAPVVMIRSVKRRMTGQPKTGYLLWGAAVILARWVHLHRELFAGKTVLEVGSGLGLSGIVAGSYSSRTILTDYQQDTIKALNYNVALNQTKNTTVEHLDWDCLDTTAETVDMVIASDIICDPTTAEGFANVIKARLKATGVAYLLNATNHSRFGVDRLQELLLAPPFLTTIVPVELLPDGHLLLDTVWDKKELKYEHYTIRLEPSSR